MSIYKSPFCYVCTATLAAVTTSYDFSMLIPTFQNMTGRTALLVAWAVLEAAP